MFRLKDAPAWREESKLAMKERRIFLLVLITLLLVSFSILLLQLNNSVAAHDSTRYVAPTGSDSSSCTESSSPCRTLQYAVDAADEGDVIKIAEGIYTDIHRRPAPSAYSGSSIVTQVAYISKTVSIQGGYTPENWTAADPDAHPTTLDGRDQGRVLFITGNALAANTLIEGLRLASGNATGLGGDPLGYDAGAGIYGLRTSANLSNSQILSNTAAAGGGLYSLQSDWTIRNTSIEANVAGERGGGLYLVECSTQMNGNHIRSNMVDRGGGGGLLVTAGDAQLVNNVIADNVSGSEGPGLHIEGAFVRALHTTVARNEMPSGNPYTEGSGIYVRAGPTGSFSTVFFTNTIVASHTLGINTGNSQASFRDSLWYGNLGMSWGDDVTFLNDRYGHPAFVDPTAGDYHLLPGSAALDVGTDAHIYTDMDGDIRPQWCGHDIGADELVVDGTCHQFYFPLILREYITFRPVQGSVEIENGACCVGGYAGQTITLSVEYTATSPFAQVTEMRTEDFLSGRCLSEPEMNQVEWEPFVLERHFPVRVVINWIGFYASVQYRDALGNISPIYCDDIAVEGHPPPAPTDTTLPAHIPSPFKTPPSSGAEER
jgi:hypothetical protein